MLDAPPIFVKDQHTSNGDLSRAEFQKKWRLRSHSGFDSSTLNKLVIHRCMHLFSLMLNVSITQLLSMTEQKGIV